MKVPQRYLLSLAITYGITNFLLAVYSTTQLDAYISIYIVEYFILTLLHSPLNPKTQKITNSVGFFLFAIFVIIVTLKIMEIVGGSII